VTVTAADPTHGTRMSVLQTSDVFDNYRWCWDALAPGGKRVQKWFYSGSVKNRDNVDGEQQNRVGVQVDGVDAADRWGVLEEADR
jgi:hypothetical protein